MAISPALLTREKAIQTYRISDLQCAQTSPQSRSVAKQPLRKQSDNVKFSQDALDRLELLKQRQAEDASKEVQAIKEKDAELEQNLKILNLNKDASLQEIRKAYLQAIQVYHPDKHGYLPPDFRQLAETRSKQINELYGTLLKLKMGES
jgi:DnaJ-domain-containing protein 1